MTIFDLNQPAVSVSESSINSSNCLALAVCDNSGNGSGSSFADEAADCLAVAVCDNSGSSYSDCSSSKHVQDDNASCEFYFDFLSFQAYHQWYVCLFSLSSRL